MKNNQKGFSSLEGLLLLIIVVISGFTGWFVYNSNKKINATYDSASRITNSASPKYSKLKSTNTPKTVAPTTTYFMISQWHVRAPYSGSLRLEYQPSSNNNYTVDVSSLELNAGGPSICTTASGAAGHISRFLPTDSIPSEGPPSETAQQFVDAHSGGAYTKVGNYYYIYFNGQSNSCSYVTVLDQTQNAFSTLVKQLVAY